MPACDAMVASYSLHRIRTPGAKLAFYRRCYRASLRADMPWRRSPFAVIVACRQRR